MKWWVVSPAIIIAFCVSPFTLLGQEPKPAPPIKKIPVPDAASQAEALKLVREVYGEEWTGATTSEKKQSLAKKLIAKAHDSQDDRAAQFMLLKLAWEIATNAFDGPTAFQAVDATAELFQVNATELKLGVLTKSASIVQNPAQHKAIAAEAISQLDQALSDVNFILADQLGRLALDEARKANEKELITQAEARAAEVAERCKENDSAKSAKATLEKTPSDAHANLVFGRYLCFAKDDWDKGLRLLTLGDDDDLKAMANQELAGASTSLEQSKLGDSWWNLAEQQNGRERRRFHSRAGYWYRQALPGLSGLMRDKVEKRIRTLGDSPIGPIVFRYDWQDDQLADWKWVGDGKPTAKNGRLEFRNGGVLFFRRTDIRISDITMDAESLDRTQELIVVVGENFYALHFLLGFIVAGPCPGPIEKLGIPVKLMGGRQNVRITIPSVGNSVLTVGGIAAKSPVKKSGLMYIQVEQSRPLVIGPVEIRGTKASSGSRSDAAIPAIAAIVESHWRGGGARRTLWSNGYVDAPYSEVTWTKNGPTLKINWPDGKTDVCTISKDGRSITGTNSDGTHVSGTITLH